MPETEGHSSTTGDKQEYGRHFWIALGNLVVSVATLIVLAVTLVEVCRYADEAHHQTVLFQEGNKNAQRQTSDTEKFFRISESPHVFIDNIELARALKPGYLSVNVSFVNSGKTGVIHLQFTTATKLEPRLNCPRSCNPGRLGCYGRRRYSARPASCGGNQNRQSDKSSRAFQHRKRNSEFVRLGCLRLSRRVRPASRVCYSVLLAL